MRCTVEGAWPISLAIVADLPWCTRARRVVKTFHALLGETIAPSARRHRTDAHLGGNLLVIEPARGSENNSRPLGQCLPPVAAWGRNKTAASILAVCTAPSLAEPSRPAISIGASTDQQATLRCRRSPPNGRRPAPNLRATALHFQGEIPIACDTSKLQDRRCQAGAMTRRPLNS
jgi:hypothetical protein